jgi:Tfp pilus assembly protein PilF
LYENKNRPDLAMKEYRAAIESNRDLAPAHSALGWMLFDRGHREEAMECFNQALRADPQNARAYLGVAKCYASRGKVQLAIENYTKAIKYEQDPQKKNEIMNNLYKEGGTWDT